MTRYLSLSEILLLHSKIIESSGGSHGIRDLGGLESAVAQPRATFGATDLYPTMIDKASILGYCLIGNHPFIDGNKRIGHAAMEVFLILNGYAFACGIDEQEKMILGVAGGEKSKEEFLAWVKKHTIGSRGVSSAPSHTAGHAGPHPAVPTSQVQNRDSEP